VVDRRQDAGDSEDSGGGDLAEIGNGALAKFKKDSPLFQAVGIVQVVCRKPGFRGPWRGQF